MDILEVHQNEESGDHCVDELSIPEGYHLALVDGTDYNLSDVSNLASNQIPKDTVVTDTYLADSRYS